MSALLGLVPGWLVVILLALAWTAIGTGLVLLVRRLVGHDRLAPHNDVAGFVFAGVGVVYAVLLAFVVIGVWDRYEVDQQAAQVEAAHLLTIHRLAGFVDGGEVVQPAIRRYAELVVSDDWPAMANGGLTETTDDQLRRVSQDRKSTRLNSSHT